MTDWLSPLAVAPRCARNGSGAFPFRKWRRRPDSNRRIEVLQPSVWAVLSMPDVLRRSVTGRGVADALAVARRGGA